MSPWREMPQAPSEPPEKLDIDPDVVVDKDPLSCDVRLLEPDQDPDSYYSAREGYWAARLKTQTTSGWRHWFALRRLKKAVRRMRVANGSIRTTPRDWDWKV